MLDTNTVQEAFHYLPPGTLSGGFPAARELVLACRDAAPVVWRWLAATLDELDYGIVLLFDGMRVVHLNDGARAELDACHALPLPAAN